MEKCFSRQMEKCGRQKVSVKLFLCSETQAKIIGYHELAGKIFAAISVSPGDRRKSPASHPWRAGYSDPNKQEVETTYNRTFLTPLFALIKTLRDI